MSPRIAIALDMDGVVIESVEIKAQAFVAVFATRWPDWEEQVRLYNQAHFGVPRAIKMRALLAQIAPEHPQDAILASLLDDYRQRLAEALTSFPLVAGVEALIHSRSFDIFLCSAAPMAEIATILRHHGLLSLIRQIFDGTTQKAEALRQIAAIYGSNCLFVGDAAADQQAAHDADVRFIHRRSRDDIAALDASLAIRDFDRFEPLVLRLLG